MTGMRRMVFKFCMFTKLPTFQSFTGFDDFLDSTLLPIVAGSASYFHLFQIAK